MAHTFKKSLQKHLHCSHELPHIKPAEVTVHLLTRLFPDSEQFATLKNAVILESSLSQYRGPLPPSLPSPLRLIKNSFNHFTLKQAAQPPEGRHYLNTKSDHIALGEQRRAEEFGNQTDKRKHYLSQLLPYAMVTRLNATSSFCCP